MLLIYGIDWSTVSVSAFIIKKRIVTRRKSISNNPREATVYEHQSEKSYKMVANNLKSTYSQYDCSQVEVIKGAGQFLQVVAKKMSALKKSRKKYKSSKHQLLWDAAVHKWLKQLL